MCIINCHAKTIYFISKFPESKKVSGLRNHFPYNRIFYVNK